MKGKIDKSGDLWIWRGNEWRKQYCHFNPLASVDGWLVACSDVCSLFGEPFPQGYLIIDKDDSEKEHDLKTGLSLCRKTLGFDEFIDERKTDG